MQKLGGQNIKSDVQCHHRSTRNWKKDENSKKETDTSRPSKRTEGAQLRDCSVGLMHCIKITVLFHLWTPIVLQWASVTIGDSGTGFEKTAVIINRISNKALLSPFVSSFLHSCVFKKRVRHAFSYTLDNSCIDHYCHL